MEVPFRPDYPDFRLEVASHRRTRRSEVRPIRERMIFDEREISAEKRAEGYRFYPEVLIDEHDDLREIHRVHSKVGTDDGSLVRLKVYLFRDSKRWVTAIRFNPIGISTRTFEAGSEVTVVRDSVVSSVKETVSKPMNERMADPPADSAGASLLGYSKEQLMYMAWLNAYRDSINHILRTSPSDPLMDDETGEVEPYLLPEIQDARDTEVGGAEGSSGSLHGGPGTYSVEVNAAEQAVAVWNEELSKEERAAAHARWQEINEKLARLYRTARQRVME